MVNKEIVKKDLIERIEALVEESCTLVRTKESWTRHVEITRAAYEKTLDVFEFNGQLKRRYRYEQVCAEPPA